MLGLEYSLSVIIVSIAQLLGFALQTVLVRKKLKESVYSHTFFFALFLALFNCSVLFLPIEMPFAASVVYVLLGAYYASIRMEQLFDTKIRFFIGYIVSVLILWFALLILHRLNINSVHEQLIVITFLLTSFYMVSGVVSVLKNKTTLNFTVNLVTAIVFTSILMIVLLFAAKDHLGMISLNLFFFGLIIDRLIQIWDTVSKKDQAKIPESFSQHFSQYGLSNAQFEVIELLAQDLDIPKIAIALGIGNNAVESRLSRIYKKTPYKSLYDLKVAIVKLNQPTT